jgi:hypothetical protein
MDLKNSGLSNIQWAPDLPLDFYIGLGYTLNYDNRPFEGASESGMYSKHLLAGSYKKL